MNQQGGGRIDIPLPESVEVIEIPTISIATTRTATGNVPYVRSTGNKVDVYLTNDIGVLLKSNFYEIEYDLSGTIYTDRLADLTNTHINNLITENLLNKLEDGKYFFGLQRCFNSEYNGRILTYDVLPGDYSRTVTISNHAITAYNLGPQNMVCDTTDPIEVTLQYIMRRDSY